MPSDWRHIVANVRRTSLNLDLELVEQARAELGTKTTTETIHAALRQVIRGHALERLAGWRFDHLPDDWLDRVRAPRIDPE